jgi:hypothetical protein
MTMPSPRNPHYLRKWWGLRGLGIALPWPTMSTEGHPRRDQDTSRRTRRNPVASAPDVPEEVVRETPSQPPIIVLLAVFFGIGTVLHGFSAVRMWQFAAHPNALIFALLSTVLMVSSLAAMLGLWRVRAWGWWSGALVCAVTLLLHTRLVAPPLAALKWDHPDAGGALLVLGLVHGLPISVALALTVLLALPRVRLAVGVKERPLQRRRKLVVAGSPGRRKD